MAMAAKRFAVLLCAEDTEYVKKIYGGYLGVFMALLEEEGEEWDVYRVSKGEFPADDRAQIYDGFVVTGSCSDADGDDAWIQNLVAFLRRLHELRKKVLGICFGHQISFYIPSPLSLRPHSPPPLLQGEKNESEKNPSPRSPFSVPLLFQGERGGGMAMEAKRFAVLLCAEDSEYVKKVYGGYLKVFMSLLEEEGEAWDVYRVSKGEFPADDLVQIYEGFVVTGSCSDADGDDAWILNLVALLRRLHQLRKKVLGICFGHQVLSRALGGKTCRAVNGWDIGVTCIHPSPSLKNLLVPPHLPVIQCHRDEVYELPPFVEVLARSEKTGIEMFRCGDHIMGIQGHPEYTKEILLHLVDRLLQHSLIQNCHAEAVKASLDAREPDREAWERVCRGFLKGRLGLLDKLCT